MVTLLCRGSVASGVQQIASHPMYLSLADPLFGRLNYLSSLGEAIQSLDRLTEPSVSFREYREHVGLYFR